MSEVSLSYSQNMSSVTMSIRSFNLMLKTSLQTSFVSLEIPNSNFKFQREIQSEFQNSSHTEKGPNDLSYVPLIIRYAETPKIEF